MVPAPREGRIWFRAVAACGDADRLDLRTILARSEYPRG